jgi:RAD51-like protein 1
VQASRLKYLAEAFSIPILVTNQVTTYIGDSSAGSGGSGGGGHLTAALGTLWAHAVNTRLVLESVQGA